MSALQQASPPVKRKRLSHACNHCRSSKKRCDERLPSCSNCLASGRVCITTDPRKEGAPLVVRKRAESNRSSRPRLREQESTAGIDALNESASTNTSPQDGRSEALSTPLQEQTDKEDEPIGSAAFDAENTRLTNNVAGTIYLHSPAPSSQSKQAAVNDDGTEFRKKWLGASNLQVFAQWVHIAMAANKYRTHFVEDFRFGMRFAEEFPFSRNMPLPPLNVVPELNQLVDIYIERVNPLYPFVTKDEVMAIIRKFSGSHSNAEPRFDEAPELACIYAISAAAMHEKGLVDEKSSTLLQAAMSLFGYCVAHAYLTSVQALGIMSIALKGSLRDGVASQVLGQAIRIAISIGIHESDLSRWREDGDARIWLACYAFENISAFDSGRPSSIIDEKQLISPKPSTSIDYPDYLLYMVELAKIQSAISNKLFSKSALQSSVDDIMPITGNLDSMLVSWTDTVPSLLRPGRDLIYCPTHMRPFATLMGLQYYTSLIMIHRTSLLMETSLYTRRVETRGLPSDLRHRLLAGKHICVQAARSIIQAISELLKDHPYSQLFNPTPGILALYVLLISIMRDPKSWSASTDLELMRRAAQLLTRVYTHYGQHENFICMFSRLYKLAASIVQNVDSQQSGERNRVATPSLTSTNTSGRLHNMNTMYSDPANHAAHRSAVHNLIHPQLQHETSQVLGRHDASYAASSQNSAFSQEPRDAPLDSARDMGSSPSMVDKLWLSSMSNDLNFLSFDQIHDQTMTIGGDASGTTFSAGPANSQLGLWDHASDATSPQDYQGLNFDEARLMFGVPDMSGIIGSPDQFQDLLNDPRAQYQNF